MLMARQEKAFGMARYEKAIDRYVMAIDMVRYEKATDKHVVRYKKAIDIPIYEKAIDIVRYEKALDMAKYEKDILIWLSWSCDQHHVYKFSFPCT